MRNVTKNVGSQLREKNVAPRKQCCTDKGVNNHMPTIRKSFIQNDDSCFVPLNKPRGVRLLEPQRTFVIREQTTVVKVDCLTQWGRFEQFGSVGNCWFN